MSIPNRTRISDVSPTRRILTCSVPYGECCPDPLPGSIIALMDGCTCPFDQGWPDWLAFASDCPVHELELVSIH